MPSAGTPKLGFIGTGIVGSALARALVHAGYDVTAIHNRSPEKAANLAASLEGAHAVDSAQSVVDGADIVFLTVPDDAIEALCRSLNWSMSGTIESQSGSMPCTTAHAVVHASGAASIDILQAARDQGSSVGAFHPLQTFASPNQALKNLPGSAFAIEASDPSLEKQLDGMARALEGTPLVLDGDKALYHASAVLACNNLVTLLDAAAGLWDGLGLSKAEGLRALLPLVRGTIENLESVGLPNALTGPVARGDVGTVERNLAALARHDPTSADLYCELARRTIPIARAKGTLDAGGAERLLGALEAYGKTSENDREAG